MTGVGMNLTIEELRAIHEAGVEIDPIFWYHQQMAVFHEIMLNHDARPMAGPDKPTGGNVWVRGDSPWHNPRGHVVSWRKALRLGKMYEDLWWAPMKSIGVEVRCYVVGDCIECRQATPSKKRGRRLKPTFAQRLAIDCVQSVVPEVNRLVIDLTRDGAIIELNPFDACGLYGRPLPEGMRV